MRRAGLSGRRRSLEWVCAPDCFPTPRTLLLASPVRRMGALWVGDCRLLYPISPHAGSSGLSDRLPLLHVFGSFILYAACHFLWRRSTPLPTVLFVSVGISYILGVLCTVVSALTTLHLNEPRTPLSWSMVAARAFEGAIVLIAWSALYFGIKHYGTVEEQRSRLLASEATAREAQLQALRYQLQPHFLFNTLNAISSLVVSKQPERATEMIAKLAGLLRTTLSYPEAHLVTLREELAVAEEYLSIEAVRFGPRLSVSLSVSPEAYEAQVPRFLLQPIVENSIRHGIARCPNGGKVAIRASASGGRLRIEIENDRREDMAQSGEEGHGLGLANTRIRLEKLYESREALPSRLRGTTGS